MAIHSSILAWKIPGTEEPGGLQSMGSQELDMTATKPPPPKSAKSQPNVGTINFQIYSFSDKMLICLERVSTQTLQI